MPGNVLKLPPEYVKILYLIYFSYLSYSPIVRCGCEESGGSWPDAAVLRSASGQPGVRGHLTSARLPQRYKQPDVCAYTQHEPPQPQSEYQQQQRPV